MKLLINQTAFEVEESAGATVLETVRRLGLTGTKEGCASGDCGACTVMIGDPTDGGYQYRTANACIVPVGQMAGKHLVTVEGLSRDGGLHPAQQAMVDCHASQCGFCTPGFVMSLAALVENGAGSEREIVLEGISGNLCRCTGYKPIVEAGLRALAGSGGEEILLPPAGSVEKAPAKVDAIATSVKLPGSEAELQQIMQQFPEARLIAGGTDLMLEFTQRYTDFQTLIDVSGVIELGSQEFDDETLRVGSAVPYSALESTLGSISEPCRQLMLRLGSRQIRNSGTIGGNLANGSPIADMPPVLIVWDAELLLVSSRGTARRVLVDDFYLDYRKTVLASDEYIARIDIPRAATTGFHRFYKSSKRIEDDISSVLGAFRFDGNGETIDAARIAFGGMAATPVRLPEVENLLLNRRIDDEVIADAISLLNEQMTPLTDVRASATYRAAMAASMLSRAIRSYRGENLELVSELQLHA